MYSNTSAMEHGVSILFFCWDTLKQMEKKLSRSYGCKQRVAINIGSQKKNIVGKKYWSLKKISPIKTDSL